MTPKSKTLIVVLGPTAAGKTDYAISLARELNCHIINADSRQVFREIPIGTAAPTTEQLALVPHHMVGCKSVVDSYNAAQYEHDVMELLPQLWQRGDNTAILCGGSMMYIDAVCRGIDPMPDVPPELRAEIKRTISEQGLQTLLDELQQRDPQYFAIVDKQNPVRVQRAIEMCRLTGKTYTSLRAGKPKRRPFTIEKRGITLDRELLCQRINARVDAMIDRGLIDEARAVYHLRRHQALNTVGYKELFDFFDGLCSLDTAINRIKKNTRLYAKKQMTWFRRDSDIRWL